MIKCRNLEMTRAILILGLIIFWSPCNALEIPNFQSGIYTNFSQINGNFSALYDYLNNIYEVKYKDNEQIVWNYTSTTRNWAWVFRDGRMAVLSTEPLNISNSDTLEKDLNNVIDNLNNIGDAKISDEARNKALDLAIRFATEPKIYHKIKYDYNSNFDLNLFVPDSKIKEARLIALGGDNGWNGNSWCGSGCAGHQYLVDGIEVAACAGSSNNDYWCDSLSADIANKIPSGKHIISAKRINQGHTLKLEMITSPEPPKKFMLYSDDGKMKVLEMGSSQIMPEIYALIGVRKDTNVCPNDLPGGIIGIDPTSYPKVKVNVFVNTSCAKLGNLKKEDFNVKENDKEAAIDNVYFSGNASGKNLDLAVVFDDTGSMQPQINAMKSKVQDLTDQINVAGLDTRYALVTFKDSASVKTNWTSDPEGFKNSVNALEAKLGDDEPEDALDAIENVISMGFRPDAQKVILVITDAHAHYKGDGTTYSEYTKAEVIKNLKDYGVIFIPVSPTFESSTKYVDLREVADEMQSMWIDINSADFSTILEKFENIITETYVLEYTSPDLTPNANWTISVTASKPECAEGCTSASYATKA